MEAEENHEAIEEEHIRDEDEEFDSEDYISDVISENEVFKT